MPFRVRRDALDWFDGIRPGRRHGDAPMSLDFDVYYLCFMAGLAVPRKADASQVETKELVDTFPGAYRQRGRVLVAAFLARELQGLGVSKRDRTALHSAIHGLVDPLSPCHLSDEGLKQFNRYSFGGFQVLTEWFDDRPRAIETFLPRYMEYFSVHTAGAPS